MPEFIANGHRLAYLVKGSGRPIIFLPGNTSSSAHLTGMVEDFGAKWLAASLDFYGTGRSQRAPVWPADWFEQAAHDTAALANELGLGPAVLVGLSGGAIVALLTAIFYPHLVRAVVADSFREIYPPELLQNIASSRNLDNPETALFWRQAHGEDWREVVQADSEMLRSLARAGGEIFRAQLGKITCPVLITAGLQDELVPDIGAQVLGMAEQIQGAQVFLCQDGRHPLMWSKPREFRPVMQAFLDGLG